MKFIKKIMFSVLVMLFGWQYGASAFHTYDKNGSLTCTQYCNQYGETEAFNAGVGGQFSYAAGSFNSCWCFTAAEITTIKNCSATPCGTNMSGYKRVWISASQLDCSTRECSCASGYFGSAGNCSKCTCGYYCMGGNRSACGYGKYSASGATTCTTCPSGKYCASSTTCTPSSCPDYPTATSNSGATSITSCYYPRDTQLSDAAGTYLFTSNCFYSA